MQIRLQDGTLSECPLWPIWPAVFIWKSALVITLSELESWKYDLFRHITINRRGFIQWELRCLDTSTWLASSYSKKSV